MFPGIEMAGRKEMLNELREIGRLGENDDCLIDPNARLGEL